MDTYTHCLNDLKARFGGQLLLSPEDIAPIIKKSARVQANMRLSKTFPFPIRTIGRNVFVSVYHLAEWLATGKCKIAEIEEQPASLSAPVKVERKGSGKKKHKYDDCLSR